MNNDLISRSALKAELMKRAVSCPKSHIRAYGSCISALEVSPAVDAEPVRHGEWILNPCNQYFRYDIPCACHSPSHFVLIRHCENCAPTTTEGAVRP